MRWIMFQLLREIRILLWPEHDISVTRTASLKRTFELDTAFENVYVTFLPWSRILLNELNITITKLTHTHMHTYTHKDVDEYVQVTFHTWVPWSSINTIIIWPLRLLRHHMLRMWFPKMINGMLWFRISQTFLLAGTLWITKNNKNNLGSSHPCLRQYRWQISKILY
jgi:hypothetical protein